MYYIEGSMTQCGPVRTSEYRGSRPESPRQPAKTLCVVMVVLYYIFIMLYCSNLPLVLFVLFASSPSGALS